MQKAVSILHNGQELRGMEHIPAQAGKLPGVILFHGFTGTKLEPHRFFLKISRALEKAGICSFRFDFLGSGESDGDFEEMTALKELDEAETIFRYVKDHPAVDDDRIMVLGLSMGGLVASLLGGKLKEEIHKLILIAPAGTLSNLIDRMATEAPYLSEYSAYDMGGNLVGKKFVEELKQLKVWPEAAKYPNEVLLIHGTNDQAVPYEVSSLYIENCYGTKGTLHTIEGADHTFNSYEWEREVIETVMKFVK